jgi:hypothetical protein
MFNEEKMIAPVNRKTTGLRKRGNEIRKKFSSGGITKK